jgi:HD-like signal output (HDOD) protein
MSAMLKSMTLEEEWVGEILSNHGYLTGSLALQVNRLTGAGFQGEEYAAGLIHDFGRSLLAVCLPEQFAAADPLTFIESSETLAQENIRLGTNHCSAGAWFADANGLPQEFISVIQHHHSPASAVKNRRLVALTAVCDHMANHLQRHQCGDEYDIKANHALFVLESCGVQNAAGRLEEQWPEIMRSALQMAQETCSF